MGGESPESFKLPELEPARGDKPSRSFLVPNLRMNEVDRIMNEIAPSKKQILGPFNLHEDPVDLKRLGFSDFSLTTKDEKPLFDLQRSLTNLEPFASPAPRSLNDFRGDPSQWHLALNSVWNNFRGIDGIGVYRPGDAINESSFSRELGEDLSLVATRDHFSRRPLLQLARKINDRAAFSFSVVPHDRLGPRAQTSLKIGFSINLGSHE